VETEGAGEEVGSSRVFQIRESRGKVALGLLDVLWGGEGSECGLFKDGGGGSVKLGLNLLAEVKKKFSRCRCGL